MSHLLSSLGRDVVQADELLRHPKQNRLFIDVRLGDPDEEFRSFRDCHIHGAVHAQIRDVFAATPTADSGNLPLPDIASLAERLQAWRIDRDTELILYGPSLALAARGWWVLRWAGLDNVCVLDGGLKAWIAEGGAVAQGDGERSRHLPASSLALRADGLPSISLSEVEALPEQTTLIDARDEASYLAGHIPRARHLAASQLWTPSGRFRTVAELRRLYQDMGMAPGGVAVAYCGGGVLSAATVLVLTALGWHPRLYVGSWSEWSRDGRRMARSATAGAAA